MQCIDELWSNLEISTKSQSNQTLLRLRYAAVAHSSNLELCELQSSCDEHYHRILFELQHSSQRKAHRHLRVTIQTLCFANSWESRGEQTTEFYK